MNEYLNDTVVDQILIPSNAARPNPPAAANDWLLPANPAEGLLSLDDWRAIARQLSLSQREANVAILMFHGKSRDQIARQLQCAPGTVRVYIDRLFAKLKVDDRLAMALRVMRVHARLNSAAVSHKDASHKDATCSPV